MKFLLRLLLKPSALALLLFSQVSALAIGAAGDTEWPENAKLEVRLKLNATLAKDGQPQIAGDLIVTNPSDVALKVQNPDNRLVLAFLVFDALGNPVAPKGTAKVDPGFETSTLAPRASFTHHFEKLEFITGSILQEYALQPGQKYRVIAIYRAAGPNGPGFTSGEVTLIIPK